jgi:hypothetical protein
MVQPGSDFARQIEGESADAKASSDKNNHGSGYRVRDLDAYNRAIVSIEALTNPWIARICEVGMKLEVLYYPNLARKQVRCSVYDESNVAFSQPHS